MNAQEAVLRVTNGQFASNTYLVRTGTTGECILIDPGLDLGGIQRALDAAALVPAAIFATHGHFDHIGSAEHFRRKYSVDLHMHPADAKIARSSNFLMMAFKVAARIDVPDHFVSIEDGFMWSKGSIRIEALPVPGHTPGSTILNVNGRLFSGDTIFRDDVWLTALPEQNRPLLIESVRGIWDVLPEAAEIYPGHGGSATFRRIKQSNIPLREMLGLVGTASASG